MHLDEKFSPKPIERSPKLIREYFDLLRWKKKDCPIELSPEVIENDESLVLIRDSLTSIQNSIASKKQRMAESQGLLSSCETSLPSSTHDLSVIDQELSSIKGERALVIESALKLEKIPSLTERTVTPPARASLKMKEAFKKLVESLDTDLGKVYSAIGIYKHIRNKPNVRISLLITISVPAFVILLAANIFFSFALIACLEFYLIQKLFYLNFQHKQIWIKYFTGTKMVSQESEAKEELRGRLKLKQQELEKKIQILESHKLKTEEHYYRITTQQKQLKEYLHLEQQEIIKLEQLHQKKVLEYDNRIEEIRTQERCEKESRLSSLDAKVQDWLRGDIARFANKAMKKLKILPRDNSGGQNVQQSEPILVLIGVPDKESPSFILEDDSDSNLDSERNKASIPYIHPEDFESEPHFDSKSRRMYGVYEFMIIFLCANFLTYYKCYFNFIRKQTVDEETCEFLYDSIVSIKVQEKSSVRLKDETQKNVYSKRLSLTMKDGKSICFRIARHRLEKNLSIRLSQIDEAAVAIRDMLRQRRIDHTITNNLSDS